MAGQNEKIAEEVLRDNIIFPLLSNLKCKSKIYKRAALYVLRSISSHSSDLVEKLVGCGAMDSIMLCLEDFDPKVREAACWATEYIAKHSPELAGVVVDAAAVPMLIVCLREPELSLKISATATLCSICKHSLDLAQACVDSSAISCLAICAQNNDCRLKRQAFLALSEISKHSLELAELVVEAEIFPDVLTQMGHTDDLTKRHAAILVREIVKHSVELAEFVVNFGGVAALVDMVEKTEGATRLPAIMALGYIGAQSDQFASVIINSKGMHHLAAALCEEKEDHILAALVWSIGQLGKHSPEHSKAAALSNVFMKMVKLYCCKSSSDDLRQKTKHSLKMMLQKCTHLGALETLLEEAPLTILKYVLGQFSKVLPHDARARRLFVTTGGLRKVQQMIAEPGTPLYEYKAIINLCFPEEIVNYYSPAYSESLLKRLEVFEPKIPPDVLLADRSPNQEPPPVTAVRCPYYELPPEGEDYMPAPPIPEDCASDPEEEERTASLTPGEVRTASLKEENRKSASLKTEEGRTVSLKPEEVAAENQRQSRSSLGSKKMSKLSISSRKKTQLDGIKSEGLTATTVDPEAITDEKWNNVSSAPAAMEIPLAEIGRRSPASEDEGVA